MHPRRAVTRCNSQVYELGLCRARARANEQSHVRHIPAGRCMRFTTQSRALEPAGQALESNTYRMRGVASTGVCSCSGRRPLQIQVRRRPATRANLRLTATPISPCCPLAGPKQLQLQSGWQRRASAARKPRQCGIMPASTGLLFPFTSCRLRPQSPPSLLPTQATYPLCSGRGRGHLLVAAAERQSGNSATVRKTSGPPRLPPIDDVRSRLKLHSSFAASSRHLCSRAGLLSRTRGPFNAERWRWWWRRRRLGLGADGPQRGPKPVRARALLLCDVIRW
jgi:hypothetical protein